MRSRFMLRVIAVLMATFLMLGGTLSASAATYGWVYVVVSHGVCGAPGQQVRDVQGNFNWVSGSSTITWEGDGDNIVYPKVALGKKTDYQIQAKCFQRVAGIFWVTTGYATITGSFTPSYHQQTFWVG